MEQGNQPGSGGASSPAKPGATETSIDAAQERAANAASEAQGRAGDIARSTGDRATGVARDAQDRAGQVADAAQGRASDVMDRTRDAAADIAGTVRDQLGPQKEQAADALDTAAHTAWRTAHQLRNADQNWLSQIVGMGAEELSGAADAIHRNDLNGLMERVRGLANRQPALFAGVAVATGFALARVARVALEQPSSAPLADPVRAAQSAFSQTTDTTQTTAQPEVAPATTYPGTTYNG